MRRALGKLVILAIATGGCAQVFDLAPPDHSMIPPDGPQLPTVHHHYVLDKILLPTTNTQARDYGLDLDGNASIDNQLGMVIATLSGMGLEAQPDIDRLIDTGGAILLWDLGADDLVTEPTATFTIYQGANPQPLACESVMDTTCRRHLDGRGKFSVDPAGPVDPPLIGALTDSKLAAGPGHLSLRLVVAASNPFTITLRGARVELTSTSATSNGKLAGAITKDDFDTKVIPAMQQGFEPIVQHDCIALTSPPDCGCIAATPGKTLLGLFDQDPPNCMISIAEIKNNSLIVSLLAPDILIEGVQALSFGASVHAVGADFTAP